MIYNPFSALLMLRLGCGLSLHKLEELQVAQRGFTATLASFSRGSGK